MCGGGLKGRGTEELRVEVRTLVMDVVLELRIRETITNSTVDHSTSINKRFNKQILCSANIYLKKLEEVMYYPSPESMTFASKVLSNCFPFF